MADRIAHPIEVAWVSTGGTGAQNYDEFASDAEVEAVIARHPDSILAVEMPHCAPAARAAGQSFEAALPAATLRLGRLKETGRLRRVEDAIAAYRITSVAGVAYGLMCMVDTDQISASPDEPGRVIRNEQVFAGKVRERTALIGALRHLASAVLLLQLSSGAELEQDIGGLLEELGEPDVSDVDHLDQLHELWLVGPGERRGRLLELAGAGELVVADGNHRSLAAQQAGLRRFLAVVTTPGSVHIHAYHRLITSLDFPPGQLPERLVAAGCRVARWAGELAVPVLPGRVGVYLPHGQAYAVRLPPTPGARLVDRLDHAVVERLVLGEVLGVAADDPRVGYVGGDYGVDWLTGEVDAGRAAVALLVSPVPVEDFLVVNLAREQMPRKSTWFIPKARAGLLVAELAPRPASARPARPSAG